MKVKINLSNFNSEVSPQEEVQDFNNTLSTLIPIGKSGIHIKEKNKGSFTSYCRGKVTNECIQRGKNSPDPKIRKKATFAQNARAWKHQKGGNLIPGINYSSISNLFVDVDTPPEYERKTLKEPYQFNKYIPDLLLDNTNKTPEKAEEEVSQTPEQYNTSYSTPLPTNSNNYFVKDIDFTSATMSQRLRSALTPHMGIRGKALGTGYYDCSNFATRVLHDLGYSNVGGTSRDLYNQTDRIDLQNIKEGDLIFLQGTQGSRVGTGKASHVAIVTDTSRLKDGFIQVAQGSPNKKTSIKEWNLNKGYYKDHYLGAGRVRSAKFGMKFQQGGEIPGFSEISDLYIRTPQTTFLPTDNSKSFISADTPPDFVIKQREKQKETTLDKEDVPTWRTSIYSPKKRNKHKITVNNSYSGQKYESFKKEFEQYLISDPDAAKYEKVLTDIAKHESNFNPRIQNTAGAPAYGYFQFWQDGQINNITKFSGLSIEDFINNPQAQIAAAVRMARSIENSFNSEDLRIASAKGYNMNALIRGAWLGGVGGVRKVLRGTGNPTDNKWYKNNKGRSVKTVMDEQI